MRRAVEVPYWIVVGVLTIVGIYLSILYDSPLYFLWAALVMAGAGAWWPGPALLVGRPGRVRALAGALALPEPSGAGHPGGLVLLAGVVPTRQKLRVRRPGVWRERVLHHDTGAAHRNRGGLLDDNAPRGVALLYVARRGRPRAGIRGSLSGLVGVAVILVVMVWGSRSARRTRLHRRRRRGRACPRTACASPVPSAREL